MAIPQTCSGEPLCITFGNPKDTTKPMSYALGSLSNNFSQDVIERGGCHWEKSQCFRSVVRDETHEPDGDNPLKMSEAAILARLACRLWSQLSLPRVGAILVFITDLMERYLAWYRVMAVVCNTACVRGVGAQSGSILATFTARTRGVHTCWQRR